jgi:TetR/AcrR family transcriptional repressor of nem operon
LPELPSSVGPPGSDVPRPRHAAANGAYPVVYNWDMAVIHSTKQRLLDVGLAMLLEHGYNDLGIQALLDATHTPKGSFYHHFKDKQDFALQVLDQYMREVHAGLDDCLGDDQRPPLARVRCFFERTKDSYREQGYLGCLLGGLGQELSGVNDDFRHKIESCISGLAERIALCLDEARRDGDIPADADPTHLANLLVDCWEGAALRSRLRREVTPLDAMLDFYFRSAAVR